MTLQACRTRNICCPVEAWDPGDFLNLPPDPGSRRDRQAPHTLARDRRSSRLPKQGSSGIMGEVGGGRISFAPPRVGELVLGPQVPSSEGVTPSVPAGHLPHEWWRKSCLRFPDDRRETRDPEPHQDWTPDRFASGERDVTLSPEGRTCFGKSAGELKARGPRTAKHFLPATSPFEGEESAYPLILTEVRTHGDDCALGPKSSLG